MATSINVTGLTAAPGVKSNTVRVTLPTITGCLPYLLFGLVEIYASTSNSRPASPIATTATGQFIHTGLGDNVTWYYWARALNVAGTPGTFFPASSTAGISATTTTVAPGPLSVGTPELKDGAVTDAKVTSLSATKVTAGTLQAGVVYAGSVSAGQLTAGTINVSMTLNAATINGGTITGGTITGGIITGATTRTSSSSTRMEMNTSDNSLCVYVNGSLIGRFGTTTGGLLSLIINSGGAAIAGGLVVEGTTLGTALSVTSPSGVSTTHAIRGLKASGGSGLVGVSAAAGGWALYAETGAVGPFTGAHDALFLAASEIEIGDIVFDDKVIARRGVDDTLTIVKRTDVAGDRRVIGVVSKLVDIEPSSEFAALAGGGLTGRTTRHYRRNYKRMTMNSLGEGQLNVCGRGGDLKTGDYIQSSDLAGKGERMNMAAAATLETMTRIVARVREDVTFDHPDQVKLVACTYHCG